MWNLLGGGLGALGSIYAANKQAESQNQANVFNYDLGVSNLDFQKATQAQNIAEQEKFAQNAVQWKVADARAAGINPLAALGAPNMSFSNTVAPQNTSTWQANSSGGGFSQAGQSLGRAISAIETPEQRAATALDLENKSLNNQYIQAKINELNAPGTAPAVPAPSVKVEPDKVTAAQSNDPAVSAGIHPDVQLSATPGGGLSVSPPHDLAALGFFHPASLSWWARHGIAPIWNQDMRPAEGKGQGFNPFTMTYWPGSGMFRYGGENRSGAPSTFGAPGGW